MEKASGVYLTIKDSSFLTGGTSSLIAIIPMLTTKGQLGLNRVTAGDFEDIVGYDLDYNPNYYGLRQALETLTYVDVWRINQNAKMANAYWTTSLTGDPTVDSNLTDFATLTENENVTIAVATKYLGEDTNKKTAVKISPSYTEQTQQAVTTQFTVEDVSTTETAKIGETTVEAGIIFYDSSDSYPVAAITKSAGVYSLKKVEDNVVDTSAIGTVSVSGNTFTITFTSLPSNDTFWNMHIIPNGNTEYTLRVADHIGTNYSTKASYDFSTEESSEIYWKNVDFGDIQIYMSGNQVSTVDGRFREWFDIDGGDNGLSAENIVAANIDVNVLDKASANVLAMNGLTDTAIINRIGKKAAARKIHVFADAPAFEKFIDVSNWKTNVMNSEYMVVCARPDKINIGSSYIYLYPSINYLSIYSAMLSNYGNLNYPPAGPSYGTISTESLIDCDYEMYANELKTQRINWQRITSLGTMIWEQRTTYALNSDLSYISTVFIIDSLSEQLVNFELNFNFRFINATDLLTQRSGLQGILDSFVTNGFLYDYELYVPTLAEAMKENRTVKIKIKVQVSRDAEVIELEVELTNGL